MASSLPMSAASGFAQRLLGALSACPEKAALEFSGRTLTYGDLDRLSGRFAARLAALRVAPGDTVAVRMESCPEMVVALLGSFRAGAIPVPVSPALTEEETRHVLTDSGAKLTVGRAGSGCPYERHVAFDEMMAAAAEGARTEDGIAGDEAIALLLYTSGTSGKSKGVEHSVRSIVSNLLAVTGLWKVGDSDRVVVALPLFHIHGLGLGVIGSLLRGATILLLEKFDAARIVSAFDGDGATLFMGVPTMYVRLLEQLRRDPAASGALARGRLFTSGSAPLPAADFEAFREATGHAVLERYGMTETFFTLSNPYDGERRPGSVGLPVPGCEIRIADDEGRDVPDGGAGELLVKGSGVMTRYRNRPGETGASYRDGWFLTGDVAARAADGYVTLHGRKSVDFVKSGGYRISTREIEDVLSRHPRVREVAVVGLPDRVWGQRVVAAVTLRPHAEPGRTDTTDAISLLRDLADLAESALAAYKRPREIVILDELPRNSLGKVQKPLLAERLAESSRGG
jgi:acyl-CoA synthetase (AMP-forming)/AMP-acid ligase II